MIHIFGGGTISHVRSHLALCAPAFGTTAIQLATYASERASHRVTLHLTKMAASASPLITNEDVSDRLQLVLDQPDTTAIIFNVAMCDFDGFIDGENGRDSRLSSKQEYTMQLVAAPKVINTIKTRRPDVFLAGFKTTAGDDYITQYGKAVRQMNVTGANWVHINDVVTRENRALVSVRSSRIVRDGTREELLQQLIDAALDWDLNYGY